MPNQKDIEPQKTCNTCEYKRKKSWEYPCNICDQDFSEHDVFD